MRNKFITMIVLVFTVFLTGCHSLLSQIHVVDVQQGNVVTPEMIRQLKMGMSKAEVKHVLGQVVLVDTFNLDRWNYVYSLEKVHQAPVLKGVTLYFRGDRLRKIDLDDE